MRMTSITRPKPIKQLPKLLQLKIKILKNPYIKKGVSFSLNNISLHQFPR